MKRNQLVLLAILCVIVVMAVVALRVGPPGPQPATQEPVQAGLPAPGASGSTRGAPGGLVGSSITTFGPVPRCGDDIAIAAVLGMVRDHSRERTLGLADVHVLGHSQVGELVQWECDAQVQQDHGEQRLRYQINQVAAEHEGWQMTITRQAAR